MALTVKRSELSNLRMVANGDKPAIVILDGNKRQWVGIGWVDEGPATDADLRTYPTVED